MSVRRAGRTTATIRRTTGSTRRPSRIRRASAGFNRTAPARPSSGSSSAGLALYGAERDRRRSATAASTLVGARLHRRGDGPPASLPTPARQPVPADDRRRCATGCGRCPRSPTRRSRSACPTRSGSGSSSARRSSSGASAARRFLVDRDGRVVFGDGGGPSDLPVVVDSARPRRPGDRSTDEAARLPGPDPAIGDTLDPVDLDAATRLGSLAPGRRRQRRRGAPGRRSTTSTASSLDSGPDGWTAVFGFYTPTIRRTDLIPDQVRLLAQPARRARGGGRDGHPGRRAGRDLHRRSRAAVSRARRRCSARPSRRVAFPKRSRGGRRHVLLPLAGPPRGSPARARPQRQRQLRVRPLLGRRDRRGARLGPRGRPGRARRRLRQSDLHQRASSPTRSWPSSSPSSAIGSASTSTSWP